MEAEKVMTRRTESQKEELLRVRDFVSRLGFAASDCDGGGAITRRLYNEHAAEKYQAMLVPRDHGGRGDDYLTAGIIYEELSYYGIGFMPALLTTVHCAELIKIAATEKQRDVYLDAIAGGKKVFGFCLTEEAAGSDITGITCEANESGDSYVISGEKSVVINSAIADYFIVIASTNPAAGRAALNAFVVDASLPGVDRDNSRFDFGFNQSVIGSVRFRDVHIPKENILGENGSGYFLVMETFDKGRPLVAAACAGAARRALDITVAYTKGRSQFGKELFSFQGVSFRLADIATRIRAAKLLYRDALSRIDEGAEFSMEASMAKLYASETLRDAAEFGLEMLGYRGFSGDSELRKIFNDAQLLISIDGSSNVQRMVIASQL